MRSPLAGSLSLSLLKSFEREQRGTYRIYLKAKHRKAQRTFQYRPKQQEYPRLKKKRKPATWIEGEEKEQTMTEKKEEGTIAPGHYKTTRTRKERRLVPQKDTTNHRSRDRPMPLFIPPEEDR